MKETHHQSESRRFTEGTRSALTPSTLLLNGIGLQSRSKKSIAGGHAGKRQKESFRSFSKRTIRKSYCYLSHNSVFSMRVGCWLKPCVDLLLNSDKRDCFKRVHSEFRLFGGLERPSIKHICRSLAYMNTPACIF